MYAINLEVTRTFEDGSHEVRAFIISDTEPTSFPTNGKDVTNMNETETFAPFTIIQVLNPTGMYILNESGTFVKQTGGSSEPVLIEKSVTANGIYSAAEDEADGYSSVNVEVSGDYDITGEVIVSDEDATKYYIDVTIPNTVTKLSDELFYQIRGLRSVNLPSNLTHIGDKVFYNCEGLMNIELPNSLTNIGSNAFFGCISLTAIEFPDNLIQIDSSAFLGCEGLISIEIPNNIVDLGSNAFKNCTNLVSVILPNNLKVIKQGIFSFCSNLTSINFPDEMTIIESSAFQSCRNLTFIDLPDKVSKIQAYAFRWCENLTNITCRATTPPTIQANSFQNVPATCTIYVPASSVDTYKAATNWSARADYIQAIPS